MQMIIGRTNKLAETKLNKNLLTKSRYYYISHLARNFIIDNNIDKLPIDLFEIILKNNWRIVKYSSLIEKEIKIYQDVMKDNWGFAENLGNNYVIFYDDKINEKLQRFTLAHEIGHILLDHFHIPIENREQEANMFAARLLMPVCVLHECHIRSPEELSEVCNASLFSANYRFDRLILLEKRNKFYTDSNEKTIKKKFKKFIKEYNKKSKLE